MAQTVFARKEVKYLLTRAQYFALRAALADRMAEDQYGLHTICNIYYDTPDGYLITRSLEKPRYKEKLRLRSYGVPRQESTVYLEIKKKADGIVSKRRIGLTLREAEAYLERDLYPAADCQILREIDYLKHRLPLAPALFLAYDRIALAGREDPDFRVTYDQRIRGRRERLSLAEGDAGSLLLPEELILMEAKIQGAAPLWFAQLLSRLEIRQLSFSKYGAICKKEAGALLLPKKIEHILERRPAV